MINELSSFIDASTYEYLCIVPHVIGQSTGISITQRTLSQMACALAEEGGLLAPIDEDLKELVATSPAVNTDDSGWWINATLAYLTRFFTTDTAHLPDLLPTSSPGITRCAAAGSETTDRNRSRKDL
jgi:hypothetical protein